MEGFFGHDFSAVRVHADAAAAASARSLWAHAYTFGDDVVFGAGRYAPGTASGRRLLAHELAHVVQQERGLAEGAALERAAQAAERGERPPGGGMRATPFAPFVQLAPDEAAIRARLQEVQKRLGELRARQQKLSESFTGSVLEERERESLARGRERLKAEARSESAAPHLWGGTFAGRRIRKGASVALSGNTATVTADIRIAYLALSDEKAQKQAAIDIPRIEAAIRSVWQVDIANGEYAGVQFRLVPKISWVSKSTPAPTDAFLIQVRGPDEEPSSGDAVHGLISLAPAHLEGSRVVVVAHELAHVFGFVDAYLTMTTPGKRGKPATTTAVVGRGDPAGRPDLLGMIDPVVLERWRKQGAITEEQVKRQSKPVHVWEEDAIIVLRTLGLAPPPRPRPTPESEDFDPQVELDRIRREGETKLGRIRQKTERAENSLEWLQITEQILNLEREEKELRAKLGSSP
jgi:Domain of unknown function (DUF4157)